MRWLCTLLLLLPFAGWAATGNTNIIGAWVEPDGYTLSVHIGGDTSTSFGTNVQVYHGLTTSFATNFFGTGTQKCTLTLESPGWSGLGVSQAVARTVLATKLRRRPYPLFNTNWVDEFNATNVVVRVAFDDYIYTNEVVTMTTDTGWIVNTNGGAVHVAKVTALSVTNLSMLNWADHSEPTMNWAHPGQQRWTNAVERVWLKGGHWSGIARLLVEATDQNLNTQQVVAAHVSTSPGRGSRKGYWVADVPTSTFTNLDKIRCDFIVYPKIGTNVFDTRLNRWTGPTPLPAAQTNFWDRFNIFTNIAVVDLGGNDTNGDATNGIPENVNAAQYLLTVDAAFQRLAATNNLLIGINEAIGTVFVRAGVSNISGGTLGAGNTARSWTIAENYPGHSVTFTNRTGDADVSGCLKVSGCRFESIGSQPFIGVARLWLDNCTINSTITQFALDCRHITFTDFDIVRLGTGLIPVGATDTSYALLRDVDVSGVNAQVWIRTAIGLTRRGASNTSFAIIDTLQNHISPVNAHTIFCDSEFYQLGGSTVLTFGNNSGSPTNDVLHGFWSENVVLESTNNLASVAAQMWVLSHVTNCVIKNWTVRGLRNLLWYNETTNKVRVTARLYNNIFQAVGFANDLAPQSSGLLTNNINYLHQVGSYGNIYQFPTDSPNHNWPDFSGVNTIIPGTDAGKLTTNYLSFQNNQAWIITGDSKLGNGDYRLLNNNDLWHLPDGYGQLPTHQPDLGFDLEGKTRSAIDPPGAFVAGNVRKGAFF